MNKRWLKHLYLAIALALAFGSLIACGSNGNKQGSSDSPSSKSTAPSSSASSGSANSGEKVTIKFWKYQDEIEQKFFTDLIDQFNQQSKTTHVELEVYPFEQYIGEKLTAGLAAGIGPDVFWLSAGDFMKFVINGLLLPLNDTFTPELQKDFLPNALKAVTVGPNIYGVPHEMGVQAIIYDKKLFKEKNLQPPTDWNELLDIAAKLKTDTRWGIMLPTNPDLFENFVWYSYLWSAGGEVIDDKWTKARISEPEGVKALQLWADLIQKGLASPKGGAPFDADVAQGKAAMAMQGHWVADNFTKNYPGFELGVAPIPPAEKGGKSMVAYGGWFSAVSASSKHPKEAKEFAVWLFGQDPQHAIDLLKPPGTYLSPRKSVMDVVQNTEYYKKEPQPTFIKTIWPNTRPEPTYPPEIVTAVTEALQQVMFGKVSAQQAADQSAEKINAFLNSPDGEKVRNMMK